MSERSTTQAQGYDPGKYSPLPTAQSLDWIEVDQPAESDLAETGEREAGQMIYRSASTGARYIVVSSWKLPTQCRWWKEAQA